ncbi:MAG: D-glycerate dehydrogenase [Rhodobacteraceae bacterium]|nr:D-glycerate dehydrogenase [Paracoccaceae bacterium]
MKRPRILFSRTLPEAVMASAAKEFEVITREHQQPMTIEEAADCLQSYDGALPTLSDQFNAQAFASAKPLQCRILANFGAGYNHIDSAAAAWHGITVTNTPGAVTDATADIAVLLMLATARRAVEGDRLVRAGSWTGWQPTQMLGTNVTGKTLGVIGMGRIGKEIARRCHLGFRMDVVFHNRSQVDDTEFPCRQLDSAEAVAASADFVVIAVRGGPDSLHLVDADLLAAMQPHGILVNISRGDVVDEAALIKALEAGVIAGAGLDVYEFEPAVPEALIGMDNVVLLPHLGTSVLEAREAMGFMALDNLKAYFAGETPPNTV